MLPALNRDGARTRGRDSPGDEPAGLEAEHERGHHAQCFSDDSPQIEGHGKGA
jgi:hypothetical protein